MEKIKAFLHSSIACKTTDAKIYNTLEGDDYPVPEQNKVCLFPFASGRTDYFNCTDVDMEGTGNFWCVTNYTTFNDVDYENGWGLCNDACPKQPGIASRPLEEDVTVSDTTGGVYVTDEVFDAEELV